MIASDHVNFGTFDRSKKLVGQVRDTKFVERQHVPVTDLGFVRNACARAAVRSDEKSNPPASRQVVHFAADGKKQTRSQLKNAAPRECNGLDPAVVGNASWQGPIIIRVKKGARNGQQ